MFFKVGDLVTRKSYDNDIVFKIIEVNGRVVLLKGLNIRLCADSDIEDLKLIENAKIDDNDIYSKLNNTIILDSTRAFVL